MDGTLSVPERPMALDRPDDEFEAGDAPPEPYLPPGGDVSAARAELAEPRTREEYYEALRAADGGSGDGGATGGGSGDGHPGTADSRTDDSGWDAVDAADRPSPEAIRVSPERTTHILDGDGTGGGHRHGTGNPGKTEFPASWDDKKIINALLDVARRPDRPPKHQEWNDHCVARGTRDDVEVVVVIARDGQIWSGWPTPDSPGVVKNPKEP
jgi:hypothetical protein